MSAHLKLGWKCKHCQNCGTLRMDGDERMIVAFERLRTAHVEESDASCSSVKPLRFWFITAVRASAPAGDPG